MPRGQSARGNGRTATRTRRPRVDAAAKHADQVVSKKGRKAKTHEDIEIAPITTEVIEVQVKGLTPLIVSRFGSKARRQILDKQQKKAKSGRAVRDPFADFCDSLHLMPGKRIPKSRKLESGGSWPYKAGTYGFPASGFKKAMVTACAYTQLAKTTVRGSIHVVGDLVPLKFKRLVMREDVVRIGRWPNKVADLRFRGEFTDWSATLRIRFNTKMLSREQIVNLLEHAGFAVGVGEWRPEKEGSFGTFAVKRR